MGKVPFHVAVAACAAALLPSVAGAATDAEVESLRAELAKLKAEYAERLSALEAQVRQLQPEPNVGATAAVDQSIAAGSVAAAGTAEESIEAPAAAGAQPGAPAAVANKSTAFNPAISLILMGNYANLSNNPDDWAIQGFIPGGDEIGPGDRSFNLGESEVTIAASVDPYFMGNLTASITADNEISVEEAYFRTTALPYGFNLKGGQFFSSLGYLNDVHAHAWDFTDQPLVYQAFFGGQMAVQGAQLKWIAPLDLLVELGVESGNGNYFPGTRLTRNGLNGYVAYTHVGGDIGDAIAWRTGLSYVDLHAQDRSFEDPNADGRARDQRLHGLVDDLDRGRRVQVDADRRSAAPVPEAAGRVHAAQGGRPPVLRVRGLRPRRQLFERPVGLVRAGRLPVPAALAIRRPLRLARLRQHEDRAGAGRHPAGGRLLAAAAGLADPHHRHVRLEPERVHAHSRAVRLGRRLGRARPTTSSSCSTSTQWAPTAPTISRSLKMFRIIIGASLAAALFIAQPAQAALRVLATTADWGSLTTELGGDKVDVYTATSALQDVHQVNAKPSLVARARTADLVVANGADLEIGWLPVLLQESGNPKIQPGTPGYFEATSAVRLLDIPSAVDRSMGDIHPLGNPHIQLDPRYVAVVAKALTARLAAIDPAERGLLPGARRGFPGALAAGHGALGRGSVRPSRA